MTTQDRIDIINHVIKTFKKFHNSEIVFGDIHMHNYLYDYNNQAYVIDLDDVTIGNNAHPTNQLYLLIKNYEARRHNIIDKTSDNIKAIISFASFLFSIDLQSIANYGCIDEVIDLINESITDKKLKEYFNTVLSDFYSKPIYFDEAMQFLEDPEIVKKYSKTLNENFANSR